MKLTAKILMRQINVKNTLGQLPAPKVVANMVDWWHILDQLINMLPLLL